MDEFQNPYLRPQFITSISDELQKEDHRRKTEELLKRAEEVKCRLSMDDYNECVERVYKTLPQIVRARRLFEQMCGADFAGMIGAPGDWLVTDENGLGYFLKDDEFRKRFQRV